MFSNFIWMKLYCWYFHLLAFSFAIMFLKFMHINCIVLPHLFSLWDKTWWHEYTKIYLFILWILLTSTGFTLKLEQLLLLWNFLYTSLEYMPINWNYCVISYIHYMAIKFSKYLLSVYVLTLSWTSNNSSTE